MGSSSCYFVFCIMGSSYILDTMIRAKQLLCVRSVCCGLCDSYLTFHEGCVGAAVVKVSAVRVVQAVVTQVLCVAQTLQDAIHETLWGKRHKHKQDEKILSKQKT